MRIYILITLSITWFALDLFSGKNLAPYMSIGAMVALFADFLSKRK